LAALYTDASEPSRGDNFTLSFIIVVVVAVVVVTSAASLAKNMSSLVDFWRLFLEEPASRPVENDKTVVRLAPHSRAEAVSSSEGLMVDVKCKQKQRGGGHLNNGSPHDTRFISPVPRPVRLMPG
jgi:hypothetical protein